MPTQPTPDTGAGPIVGLIVLFLIAIGVVNACFHGNPLAHPFCCTFLPKPGVQSGVDAGPEEQ